MKKPGLFEIIGVETLGFCNRSCWFCKFGQKRQDEPKVRMSWETIESIVLNLKDLGYRGRLSWFFINEPLLDKRMTRILKFSRAHLPYAVLTLNTNADLLTEEKYFELREAGLDGLTTSIYDDEAYQRVTNMNLDDRHVLHDMREGSGAYSKLFNRAGRIETRTERFAEEAKWVEEAKWYRDSSCKRPFHAMPINARSEVVLCCADMYGDVVMGNADEERLEDIWWNDKYTHYRTTLHNWGRRGLDVCDGCSESGASSVVYPSAWARRPPKVSAPKTATSSILGRLVGKT